MAAIKGSINQRDISRIRHLAQLANCRIHLEQMAGFDQNDYIVEYDIDLHPKIILEALAIHNHLSARQRDEFMEDIENENDN